MAFFKESSSVADAPSNATSNLSLRRGGVTPSAKADAEGVVVEDVTEPPVMYGAAEATLAWDGTGDVAAGPANTTAAKVAASDG